MAGHSKWANIKHRKERADAKKGKAFSRAAKEIISAVKMGGADPKANPRLRLAIDKAKAVNFPNDSIDRNIKKASSADQSDYIEMTYELYGHGGVGILVDIMTDNKNRIASEMRIATNKRGGHLANPGAVAFNFEKKGVIQVDAFSIDEETLFIAVTDAGAEEFDRADELYMVITAPDDLISIKQTIEKLNATCVEAELRHLPKTTVECEGETEQSNQALIEWLENIDDVDAVSHNMLPLEGKETNFDKMPGVVF